MHFRTKLTWITVTLLALSAEASALAQSAPAPAGSATSPTPARATAGATTKKSDTGANVDWNSLANRQAATDSTAAPGLALPSSAGAPIQSNAGGGDSLQTIHGDGTGATSTTAGSATRVALDDLQTGGASNVRASHAEAVIRGQINPAARTCYEKDPDSKSRQPGRLVILIKVTPAGEIDTVSVSNNIGVSPFVAGCITTAVRVAKFAAPGANGATVPAAFTVPGREDKAPPAAARAQGAPAPNASVRSARGTVAKADTQPTNGETAHR